MRVRKAKADEIKAEIDRIETVETIEKNRRLPFAARLLVLLSNAGHLNLPLSLREKLRGQIVRLRNKT